MKLPCEVVDRTLALFLSPLPQSTCLLYAVISTDRHEDIRIATGLTHLMLQQKLDNFVDQRYPAPFGILDVPYPCVGSIVLRRHVHSWGIEVDVFPCCVQDLAPSHSDTEGKDEQQFPIKASCSRSLSRRPDESIALTFVINPDLLTRNTGRIRFISWMGVKREEGRG